MGQAARRGRRLDGRCALATVSGMTTYYHASPSANRESIVAHGLLARGPSGTHTVFAIPGQPRALYLAPDLAEARRYIEHVFARFFPDARVRSNATLYLARGARLGAFDIYAVEVEDEELEADLDWPGSALWTLADIPPARCRLVEMMDLEDWSKTAKG